jgi:hypothetical protein
MDTCAPTGDRGVRLQGSGYRLQQERLFSSKDYRNDDLDHPFFRPTPGPNVPNAKLIPEACIV